MYLACLITCLLFCFSTGQLEAWAMLWDPENCSPPTYQRTQWKYPECIPNVTESCARNSLSSNTTDCLLTAGDPSTCGKGCVYTPPAGFHEHNAANMYDPPEPPENYPLMSINRTCWNSNPNPYAHHMPGCPFELPHDFMDASSVSSKQLKFRVAVVILLEHIQLLLLWSVLKRNKSAAGSTKNSWKMQREYSTRSCSLQMFLTEDAEAV